MSDSTNLKNHSTKNCLNTNIAKLWPLENEEISERTYDDDEDFDDAFKNLLRPIEEISKRNQNDILHYDLVRELDSYINHLKKTKTGSSIFIEAALLLDNIIIIYQKKVDQLIDSMMKLIGKFRAYRMNQKDNDVEDVDGNNKKKRKEKNVDFYSSFEPIKGQIFRTLKNYDCKLVNLSKKPSLPKIVLNANIKVDYKYNDILPYIYVGNGENIGKKYEYLLNCPLNRDLAVSEEFDCPPNEDENYATAINYQKSTDPLQINLIDIDGRNNSDDMHPSTPDPVIFDQTVTDEVYVANEMLQSPENVLNISQIPPTIDNNDWATVKSSKDDIYSNIDIVKQKGRKKEDNGVWLPTYTVGELRCQLLRLKSGMSVDPVFRQLIHEAQKVQRSKILEKKKMHIDEDKQKNYCYDEEMDEKLKNGEIPGFKGFDSPIHNDDFDYNFEEQEEIIEDKEDNRDNFETYQKNVMDMKKHEQNQLEIMNEQLEMRKRVQSWHDALRPVLEEEEKRTEFDIHQYGTKVLDCFQSLGEQKSFKDLVGGLEEEEVARYFLSTLMMANTCNLKIMKSGEDPDEIKIKVLKKERHHEELQINIANQVNQ